MRKSGIIFISINLLLLTNTASANIYLPSKHYYAASTSNQLTPTRKLDISALLKDNLYVAVQQIDTGATRYTHNGVFWLDTDGYFYQDGARLQGYPMPESLIKSDCTLTDLKAPASSIAAKATEKVSLSLNVDATSAIAASPFDPANKATYNYQTQLFITDSLGKTYNLFLYFVKIGTNEWGVVATTDGTQIGKGVINFSTSGELLKTSGLVFSFSPTSGATSPQTFSMDLTNSTQHASKSEVRVAHQDGSTPADAKGEVIDENGYIAENYTNGQSIVFGKLAIAEAK